MMNITKINSIEKINNFLLFDVLLNSSCHKYILVSKNTNAVFPSFSIDKTKDKQIVIDCINGKKSFLNNSILYDFKSSNFIYKSLLTYILPTDKENYNFINNLILDYKNTFLKTPLIFLKKEVEIKVPKKIKKYPLRVTPKFLKKI